MARQELLLLAKTARQKLSRPEMASQNNKIHLSAFLPYLFFYFLGAWPMCLLRQVQGARWVGAGGGPYQLCYLSIFDMQVPWVHFLALHFLVVHFWRTSTAHQTAHQPHIKPHINRTSNRTSTRPAPLPCRPCRPPIPPCTCSLPHCPLNETAPPIQIILGKSRSQHRSTRRKAKR